MNVGGSIAETASRSLVLHDGMVLEMIESAESRQRDEMDPRLRGDDRTARPTFPGTRESIPLLLLHGFTGAASTWNDLLPAFGARRRTIALSLPGHGGTHAPADPARYAAGRVAEDVVELLDALGIRRAALLGYSMGARVALHVALAAPRRVAALVLESGSPGIADCERRAARRAVDEALANDIERGGVEAFVDRWERLPLWESQRALPPEVREALRAQRLAGSARGLANALRGLGAGVTRPLHDRLAELTGLPMLLVCGALDEKYVRIAREMKAALPSVELREVEHAGHAVHLERPRELVRVVEEFIENRITR